MMRKHFSTSLVNRSGWTTSRATNLEESEAHQTCTHSGLKCEDKDGKAQLDLGPTRPSPRAHRWPLSKCFR
jgi:hypothetical protein